MVKNCGQFRKILTQFKFFFYQKTHSEQMVFYGLLFAFCRQEKF